jgi:hypothetical protein
MKYIILKARLHEELTRQVNEYILDGTYVLYGAPFGGGAGESYDFYLYQAVVLRGTV